MSTPAFPTTPFARHHGRRLVALLLGALPASAVAAPLSLEEAIRSAWKTNLGIASSGSMVTAARTDAQVARDNGLPSLILSAKGILTNEPVAAFGLKLDEQRITAADFAPARLSSPDVVGGVGVGATIVQPIYMGGRLSAGARAAATQADAEARQHDRRRQELAFQVAQAYFGAQVAAEGVRYADDLLAQARATETFTKARNQQGLALDADVARATAFRAQAEADTVSAGE
ncbi:MAG: TolC family protein, partial [Polyangia bacterium]